MIMEFGAMIARLEQITRLLESGEVSLEESIELYKEAAELAKQCNKKLQAAELAITKLTEIESENNE